MMERIRVASLQYFIRPVKKFEQFRDQVQGLVETGYKNFWGGAMAINYGRKK